MDKTEVSTLASKLQFYQQNNGRFSLYGNSNLECIYVCMTQVPSI